MWERSAAACVSTLHCKKRRRKFWLNRFKYVNVWNYIFYLHLFVSVLRIKYVQEVVHARYKKWQLFPPDLHAEKISSSSHQMCGSEIKYLVIFSLCRYAARRAWSFPAGELLRGSACPLLLLLPFLVFLLHSHLFRQFQHLGKAQHVMIIRL